MSEDGFQAGEEERGVSGIGVANPGMGLQESKDSKKGCRINTGGNFGGPQFLGVKISLVDRA